MGCGKRRVHGQPTQESPEAAMKYFTPELMARIGSPDDAVAKAAAAEWDQSLERYEQRLEQIRAEMPPHVREFKREFRNLRSQTGVWERGRSARSSSNYARR